MEKSKESASKSHCRPLREQGYSCRDHLRCDNLGTTCLRRATFPPDILVREESTKALHSRFDLLEVGSTIMGGNRNTYPSAVNNTRDNINARRYSR